MITQRAWLVGVVGFCFYLITIVNDLPSFYHTLTWLSAGVLGSSLAIALLSLIGLHASWHVPHAVVTENRDSTDSGPAVEVGLSNSGTLNKTGVLIEVLLHRASDNAELKRYFLMEALPSGSSLQTALPLLRLPRGRYGVKELRLIGSDVLGLFRIFKRVAPEAGPAPVQGTESSEQGEIVVGPLALAHHETLLSPHQLARGDGGVPATRFLGQGEDIRGTRLYAPGDDLRHVHWKSVARKGHLVVKELHHTLQEQSLVMWDGAAGTDWGDSEPDAEFNAREWGLRLTASLCRALLDSHRPCALLRLDKNLQSAGLGDGKQAPSLTMNGVNELLADAGANRTAGLAEVLQPFRNRIRRGSEIYVVTASLAPDVAHACTLWRASGSPVYSALINGAAFLPPSRLLPSTRARLLQSPPVQSWPQSAGGDAGQIVLSDENYQAQWRRLRAAGLQAVMVSPLDGSRDSRLPLHTAVLELLDGTAAAATSRERTKERKDAAPPAPASAGVLP